VKWLVFNGEPPVEKIRADIQIRIVYRMYDVRSAVKVLFVCIIWGCLEVTMPFLAVQLLGGIRSTYALFLGLYVGIFSLVFTSFVAGILLDEIERTIKGAVLAAFVATFVAVAYSILLVTTLPLHITVVSEGVFTLTIFFIAFLFPGLFLIGLLASIAGLAFNDWVGPEIRKSMDELRHRKKRKNAGL
jgi:MFS family permease